MLLALALACAPEPEDTGHPARPDTDSPRGDSAGTPDDTSTPPDDSGTTGDDSGTPPDDTGVDPEVARWTFLVYMNGDNNLESYVSHDLNELEAVGSGDGVNVVVQADRVEGYDDSDGDWTGTRRYFVTADSDPETVTSPVVSDLGELDMGAPETLAAFLEWAAETYPAEHTVLILWDHGDSWSVTGEAEAPPPPSISSDDTSGSVMSIAKGDLDAALADYVAAHGKLDLVGFDACLMASWEVAHSLREEADWMLASEISVGWEGYRYEPALARLRGDDTVTPDGLAEQMVNDMVAEGTEYGESAIDLSQVGRLSEAIDTLAGVALADAETSTTLAQCRSDARGCYPGWEDWYLDLGDLARRIEADAPDTALADAAAEVGDALDGAVLLSQGRAKYLFLTGLSIFADTSDERYVRLYARGSWAEDTRWDEWLESQVAE